VNAPLPNERCRIFDRGSSRPTASAPVSGRAFDLVLDRHEEMDPPAKSIESSHREEESAHSKLAATSGNELRPFFPRMQDFGPLLDRSRQGFRQAGRSSREPKPGTSAWRTRSANSCICSVSRLTILILTPSGGTLRRSASRDRLMNERRSAHREPLHHRGPQAVVVAAGDLGPPVAALFLYASPLRSLPAEVLP